MKQTASDFCRAFEAEITDQKEDWIELTAGPFRLYLVEDGTCDIAFSVDIKDPEAAQRLLEANNFSLDIETTNRVGEKFMIQSDGIRVNLNLVQ